MRYHFLFSAEICAAIVAAEFPSKIQLTVTDFIFVIFFWLISFFCFQKIFFWRQIVLKQFSDIISQCLIKIADEIFKLILQMKKRENVQCWLIRHAKMQNRKYIQLFDALKFVAVNFELAEDCIAWIKITAYWIWENESLFWSTFPLFLSRSLNRPLIKLLLIWRH